MKDRIRQIMESKHMTQQVFAQFIEMSPASLSSIFNGRTQPTLNVVNAIKKKIPDISLDWLMNGAGPMYQNAADSQPAPQPTSPVAEETMLDFDNHPILTPDPVISSGAPIPNSVRSTRPSPVYDEVKNVDKPKRRVVEIRVFYDDQTWESFSPAKK